MNCCDKLSVGILEKQLSDVKVKVFSEIDSTNSEAKRLAQNGCDTPLLLLAESQTSGRGRMGRQFFSPNGTGLYMSYMYTPETSFADSVTVTAAAAVAVVRAIEELTDLKPQIKWVNDIYIDGKKVCGILTEAVTGEKTYIIVGIGVNVTTEVFPEDLKQKAASLCEKLDRNLLAVGVIKHLRSLIDSLPQRSFLHEYREKSCVLGREVVFTQNGQSRVGKAVDIDRDGGLTVETEGGNVTLNTGEISLKLAKKDTL